MPLFRVKSVENANFSRYICKNLHRPKNFYTGIPVAPVTNIRHGKNIYEEGIENAVILFPVDWLGLECLNISIVAISSLCVQI